MSVSHLSSFIPSLQEQATNQSLHVVAWASPAKPAHVVRFNNGGRSSTENHRRLEEGGRGLRATGRNTRFLAGSPEFGVLELVAGWRNVAASGHGGALSSEMNVFARVARIFRSYVDRLVGSWEDPEKLLDQAVEELSSDLVKLRQASAQAGAAKRLLQERYTRAKLASDDWYRRAVRALERGDENLAREALKRKKAIDGTMKGLKAQLDQQALATDRVLSSAKILESKIYEARSKKDSLKARALSAKTAKYVGELVGSIDTSSALSAYQRMEEKVQSMEAEADALTQLTSDEISTKFAELEYDVDVEDDLKSLKKNILGAPVSDQIKEELPPWQTSFDSNKTERPYMQR